MISSLDKVEEEPVVAEKSVEPTKPPEMTDPDAQVDRTREFPSLPIGIAPSSKNKKRRKRKTKDAESSMGPMVVNVSA